MHIIVLGGAGAMGRIAVRTLTEYTDIDQITIADYNEERAREVADSRRSSNITVRQIDVNDEERLRALLLVQRSARSRACPLKNRLSLLKSRSLP